MNKRRLTLTAQVGSSYRIGRVVGTLDRPNLNVVEKTLEFDDPAALEENWSLGLIVGPSGSGKTSVARELWKDAIYRPFHWNAERAIIDEFDPRPYDKIVEALAAVGLTTPTSWIRPYATLSGGERFRCDLAKATLDSTSPIVVFDEYASVVDSTVAKNASIALRKAFDRRAFDKKFVALACRDDLAQWLEPDWTLDMSTGKLTRGRLRRPRILLELHEVKRDFWTFFKEFHYLSGALNPLARTYATTIDEQDGRKTLVAFVAVLQAEGHAGRKRVHRLVVRPEFQGIGIGGATLDAVAESVENSGAKLGITTSNSAFVKRLERSRNWRVAQVYPHGKTQRHSGKESRGSFGRAIVSFEYRGKTS